MHVKFGVRGTGVAALVCAALVSVWSVPMWAADPPAELADTTSYTYSVPSAGVGTFADFPVTRTFDQPIASVKLFITGGKADDIGYVGSRIVTSTPAACSNVGSVTGEQDVSDQVTISGNTASFLLRAQENCCCSTGWGSATQSDRPDAQFRWVVTFGSPNTTTVTSTAPIIPAASRVARPGCVLYRSDLTGVVRKAGQPEPGVSVGFRSDRGAPDAITQPVAASDAGGQVTGQIATRKRGVAHISGDNPTFPTPSPGAITFQSAPYESNFLITGYIIASEADYPGATVQNPCGLSGAYQHNFLYNRGVLMQGSGRDSQGRIITIDWAHSRRPLNEANVCFKVATCAVGASGRCVVEGTSIAVDPTVIPMGATVDIQNVGHRTAEDTGGAILNNHIDVFRGFGLASMHGFGTFHGSVQYLSGGGACE